jgi:ABC-2 type transport system permease protein
VTSLLASEFLRIRSRRIVWVLSLLLIVGMLIATGILFAKTHRASPAALASAHAAYEAALQRCSQGTPGSPAGSCQASIRPASFLPGSTFGLVLLPQVFQHTAFLLIVIGLVIGSSSVGADWQSGSIGTLLTWEPRRVRLFTTRVVIVCLSVFVLALALLTVLSGLLAVESAIRGTSAWLDGRWVREVLETGTRVSAMASLGALLGMSVAMIGRSTGAALAAIFVYLAVFENLLRALYSKSGPWLLAPNIVVFVEGIAGHPGTSAILSFAHAIGVILLYGGALFIAALTWFRARDVGN